MKNWLIKKFGGYTLEEYNALNIAWDETIDVMKKEDRVIILEANTVLHGVYINGTLIPAPNSRALIIGCYFESSIQKQGLQNA